MTDFDNLTEAELTRPAWARWLTRVLLLCCMAVVVVVVLAQPKMEGPAERANERLSRIPDWIQTYLGRDVVTSAEPERHPDVTHPQSVSRPH